MNSDDPIPLKEACRDILGGRWTPATLRAEASRGNLVIFRLGRTDCTTPADLERMVRACRENRRVRGSTWTRAEVSGSSETEHASSALAALRQSTSALKRSSQTTLARNTNRRAG
jgi:hypothetical protein